MKWLPKTFACYTYGTFVKLNDVASFEACKQRCADYQNVGEFLISCLSISYNTKTKICERSTLNSKYVDYYRQPCNTAPDDWEYAEWIQIPISIPPSTTTTPTISTTLAAPTDNPGMSNIWGVMSFLFQKINFKIEQFACSKFVNNVSF